MANVATLPVDQQLALLWRILFALHAGTNDYQTLRIAAPDSLRSAFDIQILTRDNSIIVTLTPL